jgi:uncharacterized OB-fold protein
VTRLSRDDASGAFFDAAAEGRLVVRRCGACGTWRPPLERRCPEDGEILDWAEAGRWATVVSWTVEHQHDEPRAIAMVELAEGPWLPVLVLGNPELLEVGAGVEIGFRPLGGGEPVPVITSSDGPSIA